MLHRPHRRPAGRFSISHQYGPAGWVVLATIVAAVSAFVAVATSFDTHASPSALDSVQASTHVACTIPGDASSEPARAVFFDDPLQHLSQCR